MVKLFLQTFITASNGYTSQLCHCKQWVHKSALSLCIGPGSYSAGFHHGGGGGGGGFINSNKASLYKMSINQSLTCTCTCVVLTLCEHKCVSVFVFKY